MMTYFYSKFMKFALFMTTITNTLLKCNATKLCKTNPIYPDNNNYYLEVQTHSGKVRGILQLTVSQQTEYFSFKGIPYAEPPTGKARFLVSKFKVQSD